MLHYILYIPAKLQVLILSVEREICCHGLRPLYEYEDSRAGPNFKCQDRKIVAYGEQILLLFLCNIIR